MDTDNSTDTWLGFFTLAQVKEANRESGHCWFSPDTMRFFRTRILGGLVAGKYFVTSEKPPHGPRKYSIREVKNTQGHIWTVGEFCQYGTARAARAALKYITAQ